jgi:DNA polymerase
MAGRDLDGFLDSVLDPVALSDLSTTLVPILHPSYQEVWVDRLGHTPDSYRAALSATLAGVEGL